MYQHRTLVYTSVLYETGLPSMSLPKCYGARAFEIAPVLYIEARKKHPLCPLYLLCAEIELLVSRRIRQVKAGEAGVVRVK